MSNSDWFARKLNVPPQPPVVSQPSYVPRAEPAPYTPNQPSYPPATPAVPVGPKCPECGSGNYSGTAESRKRCYDCGYPITQSGSGVGKGIINSGGTPSGPAQPSRQVASGGWNPTTIIGHI